MTAHGHPCWNELSTRDPEGAKSFYGASLGWTFDAMPMPEGGTYWICKSGGENVAGIFTMAGPEFDGVPEHWLTYFAVDDVDRRVEQATNARGTVRRPAFDAPGVGRIAIVADSNGAVSGWITEAPEAG